jgi:hypothetical protein
MPEEPAIDDLQEASSDKGAVIIKSEPVLLSFQQPIRTAKRYIKHKGMNRSYGKNEVPLMIQMSLRQMNHQY